MRIEVKYSTSQGPHLVEISLDDIKAMHESGRLSVEQKTPKGTKKIAINGTPKELNQMGQLLLNFSKKKC